MHQRHDQEGHSGAILTVSSQGIHPAAQDHLLYISHQILACCGAVYLTAILGSFAEITLRLVITQAFVFCFVDRDFTRK